MLTVKKVTFQITQITVPYQTDKDWCGLEEKNPMLNGGNT